MRPTDLSEIEAWLVQVPLLEEWAASPEFGGHRDAGVRMILRLGDAAGNVGWGEGTAAVPLTEIPRVLRHSLAQPLDRWRLPLLDLWPSPTYYHLPVGASPYAVPPEGVIHRLRHPLQAALECAALDLIAHRAMVPLHVLFGGAWRESVPVDYWMGRTTPEHAARCVHRARGLGFTGIKLKTALADPNVARMEAIREAGGPEWKVTVDPNGRFYRLDDALPTLRAMEAVGNLAIIEDPFPRCHLAEFAALRSRVTARVVVHVDPPESLNAVLQAKAAGGLNLDSHTVGYTAWRGLAAAAAQDNLPVWHGSGLDLGFATAAQLHLAAATPNCTLPGDQAGPWLRAATLVATPFVVAGGQVQVPPGVGLGVEAEMSAIERYTVGHWRISL